MARFQLALLGATGMVGQKLVELLDAFPEFELAEVAASDARVGQTCAGRPLLSARSIQSPYVISALPSSVATELEPLLVQRGHTVFSNASAHRMRRDVPILIPDVNPDHLRLVEEQTTPGKLITNSNCVVAAIAPPLSCLQRLSPIRHISVVTLQAISGAGYPGVSAMDIQANVLPYIAGEARKIQAETKKVLGDGKQDAGFSMMVHVHRVPVLHGHTAVLHVELEDAVSVQEISEALQMEPEIYSCYEDPLAPQPRVHIGDRDTKIHIGGIEVHGRRVGLRVLTHNLVRGAAWAALSNARFFVHAMEPVR